MISSLDYPAPTWNLKWIDARLIDRYRPPASSVDFKQATRLVFSRWADDKGMSGDHGSIRIDRTFAGDRSRFQVEQTITSRIPGEGQKTMADFLCESGDFPQLISWSLSSVLEQKGNPLDYTQYTESGYVEGEAISCDRGKFGLSKKTVGRPLTANWALFYAVPHWALGSAPAPVFHTLEELQFYRPAQSLIAAGEADFRFGGGDAQRLRAFKLLGRGILPTVFWLDEAGRPLIVCTSMNFIYHLTTLA